MRVVHISSGDKGNAYPDTYNHQRWWVQYDHGIKLVYDSKARLVELHKEIPIEVPPAHFVNGIIDARSAIDKARKLTAITPDKFSYTPERKPVFSGNAKERNAVPLAEGLFYYFPNALAAVSQVSVAGNKQHNLGPLHWDRSKSTNHADKILRHQVDAGTMDDDGTRHSAKAAWRALAQLEDELIQAGATPGKNARNKP